MKTRRQMFVEEYLRDYNATQAAIRAGYAENSAGEEGHRLLKNAQIKKAIEKRKAAILETIQQDQIRTLREIQKIAFIDIRHLYNEKGELKSPSEWDEATAAAVASTETVRRSTGEKDDDGNVVYETVLKVRLWDKVKALELMGKHQNIFNEITPDALKEAGVIYFPTKVEVGAPISESEKNEG
jgi:phage terminase small subunit